jgi:cytochrome c
MDGFEWNKIFGAVLGTLIFIFVVRQVAEVVYEPATPAKPGYVVEGVVEPGATGASTAPVAEVIPDFGTVLPKADVAAGKTVAAKCEQCHDISKGGPNKIGPELWNVIGRARASVAGFSYSSSMMSDHNPWTYEKLFTYLKSPAAMVPGTKMSFAGLRSADDRINLLAFLRTQEDTPAPIPAPAPVAAAPAAPAATAGAAAPAGAADKAATPAPAAPAAGSAKP